MRFEAPRSFETSSKNRWRHGRYWNRCRNHWRLLGAGSHHSLKSGQRRGKLHPRGHFLCQNAVKVASRHGNWNISTRWRRTRCYALRNSGSDSEGSILNLFRSNLSYWLVKEELGRQRRVVVHRLLSSFRLIRTNWRRSRDEHASIVAKNN